jgi:hypothetical protein
MCENSIKWTLRIDLSDGSYETFGLTKARSFLAGREMSVSEGAAFFASRSYLNINFLQMINEVPF